MAFLSEVMGKYFNNLSEKCGGKKNPSPVVCEKISE